MGKEKSALPANHVIRRGPRETRWNDYRGKESERSTTISYSSLSMVRSWETPPPYPWLSDLSSTANKLYDDWPVPVRSPCLPLPRPARLLTFGRLVGDVIDVVVIS